MPKHETRIQVQCHNGMKVSFPVGAQAVDPLADLVVHRLVSGLNGAQWKDPSRQGKVANG